MTHSIHILTVHGRRYASGLYWQPLTRPRTFQQEARDIGARDGFELATLRKGRLFQAGLAKRVEVGPKATFSLAAAVAAQLGDDFVAVFEDAPEHFVLVACKGGSVIPDCDVHGDRDEIESRLRHAYNQHNLSGRVICPSAFGFGGEEIELPALLDPKKVAAEWRLAPLRRGLGGNRVLLIGGTVFALGAMAFGYQVWREKQEEEQAAIVAAAAAQEAAQQAQQAPTAPVAAPVAMPHPWIEQPKVDVFVSACMDVIGRVPLSLGGWTVESAQCDGVGMNAVFHREVAATVTDLRESAAAAGYTVQSIADDAGTATLSVTLAKLSGGGDDPILPIETPTEVARSVLQRRQIVHQLTAKPAPEPPAPQAPQTGDVQAAPPPVPDWKTYTLSITGRYSPADALSGFDSLPGLRITSVAVKRSASVLEWAINGEINGK